MSVIAKGISKLFKPKRRRGPKAKAKAKEQVEVLKQERKSKPVQKPPNREGQASTSKSKNPDAVFESGDNKITAGRSSSPSIIDNTTKAQKNRANKIVALEKKVREGTATSAEKTELKRLDKINRDDTSRAVKSGAFTRGTSARKKRLEDALQRKAGGKVKRKAGGNLDLKAVERGKMRKTIQNIKGTPSEIAKDRRRKKIKKPTSLPNYGDFTNELDETPNKNSETEAQIARMIKGAFDKPKLSRPSRGDKEFTPYLKRKMPRKKAGGKVKGYKKGGPITYRMSGGQVVGNSYD